MKARQAIRVGRHAYVGADFYPYQVTAGISLRWFERRPRVRIYLGPFKVYAGGLTTTEEAAT